MKHPQSPRKRITQSDVARLAGVSPMTVSKALRMTGRISDETRDRVRDAAAKLGYVPNRLAGSLSSRSSEIVAVILPSINDQIYGAVITGINTVVRPRGFLTFIGESNFESRLEEEIVQTVLSLHPAGIVVTGGINRTELTKRLLSGWGCPIVEIWDDAETSFDGKVSPSHDEAGRLIAGHFLDRGYKAPAYIGSELNKDLCAARRSAAFQSVMQAAGRDPAMLSDDTLPRQWGSGRILAETLMRARPETDAIYCLNDAMALGALSWLHENGYSVPDDVAVAGFNGTSLSQVVRTQLTTVHVDCGALGRIAASALMSMLDGERSTECETLPTQLVIGNTT